MNGTRPPSVPQSPSRSNLTIHCVLQKQFFSERLSRFISDPKNEQVAIRSAEGFSEQKASLNAPTRDSPMLAFCDSCRAVPDLWDARCRSAEPLDSLYLLPPVSRTPEGNRTLLQHGDLWTRAADTGLLRELALWFFRCF